MKHQLLIFIFALLGQLTSAYNSNNQLVKLYDTLTVFDEKNTTIGEWNMTSFPYIAGLTTNLTTEAQLCWAPNISEYNETCHHAWQDTHEGANTTWILIDPFAASTSNEIITDLNDPEQLDNFTNVVGLIFETNQLVTTNSTYEHPPIISEASYDTVSKFEYYSYNHKDDSTKDKEFHATYTHTFVENCYVLDAVVPTYYVFASLWTVMALGFTGFLYKQPSEARLCLQKSLIIFPALKALETVLEGAYLGFCPWLNMNLNSFQYIQMARISVVTICYTVFLAFFYLLCKGWQIVVLQLNRNQATNLTMIMGAVYLVYSAYFLSQEFKTIFMTMNLVLALMYTLLGFTYTRNNVVNMKRVGTYLSIIAGNQENVMSETLKLKFYMIKYIAIGTLTFCANKILLFGIVNNLGDQFVRVKLMLTLQFFDFIWIGLILWGCRPRKEWPAYFTLAINDFAPIRQGADGEPVVALPPALSTYAINTLLTNDDDFDIEKDTGAIGDNDAVIIINPTMYTLDYDDFAYTSHDGEKSAFDPDVIVAEDEEAEERDRIQKLQDMKTKIATGEQPIDEAIVKSEMALGFRDQKQVRKQKRESEKQSSVPRKQSLLQRMKSWRPSLKSKKSQTSQSQPLLSDASQSAASNSSSDDDNQPKPEVDNANSDNGLL